MKIKHILPGLISITTLFFSCVGEDVVFVEELSNSVNFERKLHSIASDEDINLNLIFRDSDNNIIIDESLFNIEYSSDDETVLTINNEGVITPIQNGVTTIKVNASTADFIFPEIEDDVIVGKVTITESEAQLLSEEELNQIVNEGYTPKITITNPISEIDLEESESVQFNAVYQNIKNQIEEVTLIWESSDTNILEITDDGTLIPVSKGEANITASFSSNEITVTSTPIQITVSEETVVIEPMEPIDEIEVIGFGSFQSNSSYTVTGNFQIITENGVTSIILDDSYAAGGVPDLVIYLSNQTTTNNGASFISEDITSSGGQSFIIPDSINPDDYQNVLLFCRNFGVRVGFGVINR